MTYAGIITDIMRERLDKVFTYRVPKALEDQISVGTEVKIPFGNGKRKVSGYVVSLSPEADVPEEKIKDIDSIIKEHNAIEERLVALSFWMADTYGSTKIKALKTVLPAKQKVRGIYQKTVVLTVAEAAAREALAEMERKHQKARVRLLSELLSEKEIPYDILTRKLHVTKAVLTHLTDSGLASVTSERTYRDPAGFVNKREEDKKVLMPEQAVAVETIIRDLDEKNPQTYLLYGVTGSGKTEVYLRVIEKVVKDGGSAIVLIPEIALTYQTVMRFRHRFGSMVSIIHSRLSKGERYDQYLRAKEGKLKVIIGPRSALFMPLQNLRLIVMDEEHESSYKSETAPRYHAREVAAYRARQEGAALILGSATPSLEAYSRALRGDYVLLSLKNRVEGRALAHVITVDMRKELRNGNRSVISRLLDEKIRAHLQEGAQVMLFLNRRGFSACVTCRECGHVMKCPHCDVALTQHKNGKLICHYCGYEAKAPKQCPACTSPYIGGMKAGTEQIEDLLRKNYPGSRVLRMDMDTTREKEGHAKILSAFGSGEADILLGTQMIVKGHDFPRVTLVGVLAADLSLHTGDFRSAERTFALLTQAAGRAGRGKQSGEVIIQTYDPVHYAIAAAANQDYEAFYRAEMDYREMMRYPPAAHLLSVMLTGKDEAHVKKATGYLKRFAVPLCEKYNAEVFGPGSPAVAKLKDSYRRMIYCKHEKYAILVKLKDMLENYIAINKGFDGLHIQIDFEG